jgi:hypothetical protein
VPRAPDRPRLGAVDDDTLAVRWSPAEASPPALSYSVALRAVGAADWDEDLLRATGKWDGSTRLLVPDLNPGCLYEARLRAINCVGAGPWSEESFPLRISECVPSTPPAPEVLPAGDALLIRWNLPPEEDIPPSTRFAVTVREVGEEEWLCFDAATGLLVPRGGRHVVKEKECLVFGVRRGVLHEARLRTGNVIGWGPLSPSSEPTALPQTAQKATQKATFLRAARSFAETKGARRLAPRLAPLRLLRGKSEPTLLDAPEVLASS